MGTIRLDAAGDEPLTLTLAQLGITLDAEATAAAAMDAGRRDLPLGLRVWLPGGATAVAPVVHVDATAYKKGLEAVRADIDEPAKDARLKLIGERVAVVPAQDGREVDAVALERAVLAAVAAGRGYAGPVPTRVVAPEVSTVDAEARGSAAAQYLARPVTLRYRSKEVTLTPAQMADMLSVNKGDDADQYPLTFHNDHAAEELHRLFAFAETPPVDATVEVNDDGTVHVTESESGMVLDMPVLMDELDDAATGGGMRTIFVALTPKFPELSTADVQSMGLVGARLAVRHLLRPAQHVQGHQHRPGRQAGRRLRRRSRRDVLAQRRHGAAHGQPRLRLRAGDRRRQRAAPGGRRRHLPVRDDALQRRVLRRPAGGGARCALAVHLALPDRPRRDGGVGQLSTSSSRTTPARAS